MPLLHHCPLLSVRAHKTDTYLSDMPAVTRHYVINAGKMPDALLEPLLGKLSLKERKSVQLLT